MKDEPFRSSSSLKGKPGKKNGKRKKNGMNRRRGKCGGNGGW